MNSAEVHPNLAPFVVGGLEAEVAPLDQFRMYAAPQKQCSARVPEIVPANREEPASEAVRTIY